MFLNTKNELIDTLQSIELAEGVEVKTRIAGLFPRAMALLLDTIIMMVLFFLSLLIIGWVLTLIAPSKEFLSAFYGWFLIYLFLFVWFYNFFFERGKKAATWGKRTYSLKVVSADGTRATARQVFIRNVLRAADFLPGVPLAFLFTNETVIMGLYMLGIGILPVGSYGIGIICCLFTKKFQRVGDLVGGTVVVHVRDQVHAVAPLPPAKIPKMPRLQIKREEEVAIRSFCERAGIWSVARRVEIAQHAEALTGKQGVDAVEELAAYSRWIVERK